MSFNNAESNTQRLRTTRFKTEIDTKAKKIVELVNKNTIFKKSYSLTLDILENKDGNILVYFNITDNPDIVGIEKAYVIGKYKIERGVKKGHCTYASSELGMKTGTFLFNLLLLLNVTLNVEDFTLDNFAEDQERAARGIYKQFEVNKRGKDPLDFKGKPLKDQLSQALGEMRLRLRSDSEGAIKNAFDKIIDQLEKESLNQDGPWDKEFANGIRKFLSQMSEQGFYAMGGKKTRKTKKMKKSKKSRKSKKSKKSRKSRKSRKMKKMKK